MQINVIHERYRYLILSYRIEIVMELILFQSATRCKLALYHSCSELFYPDGRLTELAKQLSIVIFTLFGNWRPKCFSCPTGCEDSQNKSIELGLEILMRYWIN